MYRFDCISGPSEHEICLANRFKKSYNFRFPCAKINRILISISRKNFILHLFCRMLHLANMVFIFLSFQHRSQTIHGIATLPRKKFTENVWQWKSKIWSHSAALWLVHHNLFITPLLGSLAETVTVKQACNIHTKMYRLYRKMTIYGHFSIYYLYIFGIYL